MHLKCSISDAKSLPYMNKELRKFIRNIQVPLLLVALLWLVEIIEQLGNYRFVRYGIYPRELDGIAGIISAPFIHSDWNHLISNSLPILALGVVMMIFYQRVAVFSLVSITLITGLCVWIFARPSYHIGASGVVYGMVSFVFWSGIFRRNIRSIILSLIVLMMYSGLFPGILPPEEEGISWESHLFGALSGIFVAFIFKSVKEEGEEPESYHWPASDEHYFLPRDVFEKTIQQRIFEEQKRILQEQEAARQEWERRRQSGFNA
jgi:membrane associated rhomboid family serine protease